MRGRDVEQRGDGDGAWATQRRRQTDGLTRTAGFYIVLAVTMTEKVLERFQIKGRIVPSH